MFVTDDDLLPRGKRDLQAWWVVQLRRTVQLSQWSGEFESPEGLVVRSARSQHLDPAFGTGWLAVGDAAMAFDPLSSQGIAKALDHGKRAASSIAAYFSGDRLSLETFSCQLQLEYANYLATRARYCRLEMRWPRSLFWKRRHDRAIALADGTS